MLASHRSTSRLDESSPGRAVERAYLRGAVLAAGSVSGPRNAHVELRTATPDRRLVSRRSRSSRRDRATRRRATSPRRRLREERRARSPSSSRSSERTRRRSRSRRRRSSAPRGRGRTGSRTLTMRTSSGHPARRRLRCARSEDSNVAGCSRRFRATCARSQTCGFAIPPSPCASSPPAAARPRPRLPYTGGSSASNAWPSG